MRVIRYRAPRALQVLVFGGWSKNAEDGLESGPVLTCGLRHRDSPFTADEIATELCFSIAVGIDSMQPIIRMD
ncbi:MAG: hypothetical protein ACJ746_03375 [Bryobacteraceae bacterium]